LKNSKILDKGEFVKLKSALLGIYREIKEDKFKPDFNSEDIHTDIQNKVEAKVGGLAQKLHTLRSRNDQIAFDEKYYCLGETLKIGVLLINLRKSLLFLAEQYSDSPFIGYTHTQRAQNLLFKDYVLAFSHMFKRDSERLKAFGNNLILCIGSGAFKGTSLTEEYDKAIKEILNTVFDKETKGFNIETIKNPLEHVSDRDFIIELLSAISILQMHLSRFAEDMILFSTKEFNFVDLPEEFCTGSSMMPHKKNPDFLELVRGYTGRIYGNLMALLTTMKGLPLTYNRDMQLDKEPLFSSVEIVKDELKILDKFIKGIKLNQEVIKKALEDESLYTVELAEYLVKEKKVSFAQAHEIVGKLIRYAEDNKCRIKDMEDNLLKGFSIHLDKKIIKAVFR
ncbi:MAG: argininosuccinate lyase, partial [Candidatus Omnitrophota bacterium]